MVTFRAESQTPFDVSALVADANLRALTSADFVFYNQPSTAGVQLDQSGIRVELDRLHPDAAAVLCIVSVDPAATAAGAFRTAGLSATLSDQSGSVLAEFAIPTAGTETAVICWELYRKSSAWKIRAVGQGYAGGLAELISVHGVEVDDKPAQPAPTAAPAWDSAVETVGGGPRPRARVDDLRGRLAICRFLRLQQRVRACPFGRGSDRSRRRSVVAELGGGSGRRATPHRSVTTTSCHSRGTITPATALSLRTNSV